MQPVRFFTFHRQAEVTERLLYTVFDSKSELAKFCLA